MPASWWGLVCSLLLVEKLLNLLGVSLCPESLFWVSSLPCATQEIGQELSFFHPGLKSHLQIVGLTMWLWLNAADSCSVHSHFLTPPTSHWDGGENWNKQTNKKKNNVEHTAEIKLFTKTKGKDNNYDIYILCMMLCFSSLKKTTPSQLKLIHWEIHIFFPMLSHCFSSYRQAWLNFRAQHWAVSVS